MIQVFITAISLQAERDLLRVVYEPDGFRLEKNRETSFPIIPVIAEKYAPGDDVKVVAVRLDNIKNPHDYAYDVFLRELETLGISREKVADISVSEHGKGRSGLMHLLMALLDAIPEGAVVNADVTFGTKPISAILLYAMSFIEKMKEAEVEGIYYGEIERENRVPVKETLYDLTPLKNLGDVIDDLRVLGIDDLSWTLHRLMVCDNGGEGNERTER